MLLIRIFGVVLILLALAWSAYWYYAKDRYQSLIVDRLSGSINDGWTVELAGIEVRGFPNRLDATLHDVRVRSERVEWRLPFLQALSLSYRPRHLIFVFPPSQTVVVDGERLTIEAESLKASLRVNAATELAIEQFVAEADGMVFRHQAGWSEEIKRAILALRQSESASTNYDLSYDGESRASSVDVTHRLARLLDGLGTARVRATLSLDAALAVRNCRDQGVRVSAIEVGEASATIADADIMMTGSLDFDESGAASGDLALTLNDWGKLLDFVMSERSGMAYQMLRLMAKLGQPFETTLAVKDGSVEVLKGISLFDGVVIDPLCGPGLSTQSQS